MSPSGLSLLRPPPPPSASGVPARGSTAIPGDQFLTFQRCRTRVDPTPTPLPRCLAGGWGIASSQRTSPVRHLPPPKRARTTLSVLLDPAPWPWKPTNFPPVSPRRMNSLASGVHGGRGPQLGCMQAPCSQALRGRWSESTPGKPAHAVPGGALVDVVQSKPGPRKYPGVQLSVRHRGTVLGLGSTVPTQRQECTRMPHFLIC